MARRGDTRGVALPHLEEWRLSRAMSQQKLAELSGVSRGAIGDAEQGGNMRALNVGKIAAALHITPVMLIYRRPAEEPIEALARSL